MKILIDDVLYSVPVSEETIQRYVEMFKDMEEGDRWLPVIDVINLYGASVKLLYPDPEDQRYLRGGKKYIIVDGRHRMLALKRLGYVTIEAKIVNLRR